MSLLSQFYPSGGGGFTIAQKVEVYMVGGGGGAGASGGIYNPRPCSPCRHGVVHGGGGGGGQVVFSDGYEVIQDVSYPITIGAGGAGGGFYYDPNIYFPRACVQPTLPTNCFCPQISAIQGANAATLRGSNGGNTIFGSVVAYGGGGGGAGFSISCNYLPAECQNAAFQNCTGLTATGASAGTGGGSGSGFFDTVNACLLNESLDPAARGGKAIYNDSLQFLKFGGEGVKFALPANVPCIGCAPQGITAECLATYLTFATGGGGNNVSGSIAGSTICLQTPLAAVGTFNPTCVCIDARSGGSSGYYSVSKIIGTPFQPQGCAYAAINAFMEGQIGSGGEHNKDLSFNDFLGSLRGADGHQSQITPSPEYFGGGGGVAYAASSSTSYRNCATVFGATLSPGNPCYPSPVWSGNPAYAPLACPYGGQGGGGCIRMNCISCLHQGCCNYRAVTCAGGTTLPGNVWVGVQGLTGAPVPSVVCPGAGEAGKGGGGASFTGGCQFASTGSVHPCPDAQTCAFCGYAGGSGTVIIRYPTVFCAATVSGNTPITPQTGYHIYKWTSPGSITFPSS